MLLLIIKLFWCNIGKDITNLALAKQAKSLQLMYKWIPAGVRRNSGGLGLFGCSDGGEQLDIVD